MSGRRNIWWARSAVLLLVLLLVDLNAMAGGGPTRASGKDIVVTDITSHTDGSFIGMTPQTVTALLSNDGTEDYLSEVNATLAVLYPANLSNMSVVFTNTINLGTILGDVGNSTSVIFPQWTPAEEGDYAINVSVDAQDDHNGSNSVNITVTAMIGKPVDLTIFVDDDHKVIDPGEIATYFFKIRNEGLFPDTFDIEIQSDWVEDGWANVTEEIGPGNDSNNIVVNVRAPDDPPPGEYFDMLTLTATSRRDDTVFKFKTVRTDLPKKASVSVTVIGEDPKTAYPGGGPVSFDFLVTNTGDIPDAFNLSVSTRPSSWGSKVSILQTKELIPKESTIITAGVTIPPLNFETMEADHSIRGDTGALILKASGRSTEAVGTGEGTVIVGLVHTVQIEVSPPNRSLGWDPNVIQNATFNLNITSINNIRDGVGVEMDVNMTMPEGPFGVLFYPYWDLDRYNESESKRWIGGLSPRTLHLESGETSRGTIAEISAPPFPYQGTAEAWIEATPLLGEGEIGRALPARERIRVYVEPALQFKVEPPRTEFYEEYIYGAIDDDVDNNGVPDWQEGAPGETLMLPFNITNMGNAHDIYEIFAGALPKSPATTLPDDWDILYPPITERPLIPFWYDPLNREHSWLAWVQVTIPAGTPIGETTEIKIAVTSAHSKDPRFSPEVITIEASIDIYVIQGFGLDLEPEESSGSAAPDETIEYRLNVTNLGNGVDTIVFIPVIDDLQGWEFEFNVSDIELAPLERFTVTLYVTPSISASADDVLSIQIRAQSLLDPSTYDDVWINTTVEYVGGVLLELVSLDPLIWRNPGEIATFKLMVTNTGNGNDSFQLHLELGADNWGGVIDAGAQTGQDTVLEIERGGTRTFLVNISLPSLFSAKSYSDLVSLNILAEQKIGNMITASPNGAPDQEVSVELTVGVLQMHKTDLFLAPGEASAKNVIVGETVNFRLIIKNTGNGNDLLTAIHSSRSASFRQLSWTYMESGPFDMAPFGQRILNLSVEPDPEGLPQYGERIDLTIEAVAGNGVTYKKINVTAQIVLTRLLTDLAEVDLGTEGEIRIRICNMPAPGTTPVPGFHDQKSFEFNTAVDTQSASGVGWIIPMSTMDVTLIDPYQVGDVSIPIQAPSDLLTNSETASIQIDIRGIQGMASSHRTMARAVYFDASISADSATFQDLYESRNGKAFVKLKTTGTRGQDVIPIIVKVGGEVIGEFDAGPANPQDFGIGSYGAGEQEIIFTVDFELPTLKWYEKGEKLELEVIVDPNEQIVENTVSGRSLAESNNVLRKEFIIKNYTPNVAFLILSGLLLLFAAVAGVIGFFYLDRKNSWYLIPLSVGLSGLFAMLFYVPLEESSNALDLANGFGLGIIAVDIFFIMPVMVYLYTRSGDAYILHLINKRRGREIVQGQEVTPTILKPVLVSLIGGTLIILIPALYWVIPSEMNKGFSGVLDAFFGFHGTIPVWIPILLIPSLAVGLQMLLIQFKRGALKEIEEKWDNLERLKTEIEEGFK